LNADPKLRALILVIAATALFGAGRAEAQVAFPVSFDANATTMLTEGERASVTSHLQAAGAQWAAVLDITGPRSIEVLVVIDNVAPRSGGSSVTTALVGVIDGRDTYEQGAAAELRTGVDPNGVDADISINFNTTYLRDELWFDPDPVARTEPVDVNRTDAMSVALHELGHALAYNGWADAQGVPPPTFWSTFDRWMLSAGSPIRFDGPEVVRTWGTRPELTTGNIHHWANGPAPRPAESPRGAAILHWHQGRPVPQVACAGIPSADAPPSLRGAQQRGNLPPGLINELMNGVVFYRGSRYEISPLDVAALADAGLPVIDATVFFDGFESAP
jgi:hypothetical protein